MEKLLKEDKSKKALLIEPMIRGCVVCKAQIIMGETLIRPESELNNNTESIPMTFLELIKNLMPRNIDQKEKAKGC